MWPADFNVLVRPPAGWSSLAGWLELRTGTSKLFLLRSCIAYVAGWLELRTGTSKLFSCDLAILHGMCGRLASAGLFASWPKQVCVRERKRAQESAREPKRVQEPGATNQTNLANQKGGSLEPGQVTNQRGEEKAVGAGAPGAKNARDSFFGSG